VNQSGVETKGPAGMSTASACADRLPYIATSHSGAWILLSTATFLAIVFGLREGVGFTNASVVRRAVENATVRSFAVDTALGVVALFGLGSGRVAARRRVTHSDAGRMSSDGQ
jgi:hypothetical protein